MSKPKPSKPKRPPLAAKRVIPTPIPDALLDAFRSLTYNPVRSLLERIKEQTEPSPPETMADLLHRVCTANKFTRDTWAADHGFSRSHVYEFLKDGEGSRVKKATQSAIGKAIMADATKAGLI